MSDLAVIFRTRSESEARIVEGLLDANGVRVVVSSDVPQVVFPTGEIRLAVRGDEAALATEIIEHHRREVQRGEVINFPDDYRVLERRIGYHFRDRGMLEHALTHRSRAHEDVTGGVFDNESLEFLGDAILGFVIAELLYRRHPELDEGAKSKLKAAVVSAATLAKVASSLDLGAYLLLGRGEEKTGGRRKLALLANTCEALIAAIYLDGGVEPAHAFITREFTPYLDESRAASQEFGVTGDHKSVLQEVLQSRDRGTPEYRLVSETGPDHDKLFSIEVVVEGEVLGRAEGRTKKEAEQQAARQALEQIVNQSR